METVKVNKEIQRVDNSICRHLDNIERDGRPFVAQDVVADLRHFVEHVMLKIYAEEREEDVEVNYRNLCEAIKYVESRGEYKKIRMFHDFLQMVVSHYKPDEENSERLMLKYYEYLYDMREFLKQTYNFITLHNLEKFPLDMDPKLKEYYEKIAIEIEKVATKGKCTNGNRFYIQKVKPFFISGIKYYEVTFAEVNDKINKTDRLIAFTKIPIMSNYASKMEIYTSSISIIGNEMPINIIVAWEVAIRNCEFKNFCKIFNGVSREVGRSECNSICQYMTVKKVNLLDIVLLSKDEFSRLKEKIVKRAQVTVFINAIEKCRTIILRKLSGENILRILIYTMNNDLIKSQYGMKNSILSNLYLDNGCIPFDRIPFTFSPKEHNIRFNTLINCIDFRDKIPQLLARHIKNNSEVDGILFTPLSELEGYGDIELLSRQYNEMLYYKHRPQCEVRIQNGHAFIYSYVDDCNYIVKKLAVLSRQGVKNYTSSIDAWLSSGNTGVDCEEKKSVLRNIFAQSLVGIIYGAAGTGKSTFIKHLAHFWASKEKLFLAQTNPAVDNLKRKVEVAGCEYSTISKFIATSNIKTNYDVLIIDECSTVDNMHMRKILDKAQFSLLLLVGDIYQISSIRFGNWFSIVKQFIPRTAVYELEKPYRSKDDKLLELWNRVRNMEDSVTELISRPDYSRRLDDSIFERTAEDEIILCLNYDGLYGINNLNRFLQESNSNEAVVWGFKQYKVGDHILFNESERFSPIIYNNMKGVIRGINILEDELEGERIIFDIELDKVLNGLDVMGHDFIIVDDYNSENTVVRFSVFKRRSDEDEDDVTSNTIVPFQIAYAVSIHKAQGLEYDSVKIVITNEVDEMITHNIFYTAITRARKDLKIYWSPEVQEYILSSISPRNTSKDVALLKKTIL